MARQPSKISLSNSASKQIYQRKKRQVVEKKHTHSTACASSPKVLSVALIDLSK